MKTKHHPGAVGELVRSHDQEDDAGETCPGAVHEARATTQPGPRAPDRQCLDHADLRQGEADEHADRVRAGSERECRRRRRRAWRRPRRPARRCPRRRPGGRRGTRTGAGRSRPAARIAASRGKALKLVFAARNRIKRSAHLQHEEGDAAVAEDRAAHLRPEPWRPVPSVGRTSYCIATKVRPMKMTPRSRAMATRVLAAFLASGGLNAGTPLAIASTPVRATDPPAKARSSRSKQRQRLPFRARARVRGVPTAVGVADQGVDDAHGDGEQGHEDEEVGGQGEDVAGLANAAQVGGRATMTTADRGQLDRCTVPMAGNAEAQVGDGRGGRDGDGHHVVDHQSGGRDARRTRRRGSREPRRTRRLPTGTRGRPAGS